MKIGLSDSAFRDLDDIIDHYAQEGVPEVGREFVEAIINHIGHLSAHPNIGRVVPEFQSEDIREIIHKPFRVVYLRVEKSITVIRVWRSERLLVLHDNS